jgi:hypothetical protein
MWPVKVKAAAHPLFFFLPHRAPHNRLHPTFEPTMSTQRSHADIELIDALPTRVLTDFRDYVSTASQAPKRH